mgnify:CR=1
MRRFDDPSPWCRSRAAQKRACPKCGKRLRFEFGKFNPNSGYDVCDSCSYFQSVTAPRAAQVDFVPPTLEEQREIDRRSMDEYRENLRREAARKRAARKCAAILRMTGRA